MASRAHRTHTDDAEIERVLVITAHPDDVDFGAAGTVATWTDAGIEVTYCICTDGEAGGSDRRVPARPDRSDPQSRADRGGQARSASPTCASSVTRTAPLIATLDLRRDICRVIRQVQPQRVLVPSPERDWHQVGAATPTTAPPATPRSTRSTPTPATRSRIPALRLERASSLGGQGSLGHGRVDGHDLHYVDVTDTVRPQDRRAARRTRARPHTWTISKNSSGSGSP